MRLGPPGSGRPPLDPAAGGGTIVAACTGPSPLTPRRRPAAPPMAPPIDAILVPVTCEHCRQRYGKRVQEIELEPFLVCPGCKGVIDLREPKRRVAQMRELARERRR